MEQTLILLKPDAVERGLEEDILARFEKSGLRVVNKKEVVPGPSLIREHYPESMAESLGKKADKAANIKDFKAHGLKVLNWLRDYLMGKTAVAVILEGKDAIKKAREITGTTDPSKAEEGTIRGDWGKDSLKDSTREERACRNLVHASGDKEEAEREIELWFGE